MTLLGGWALDVQYASAPVLRAVGVPEGAVGNLLRAREGRVLSDPAVLTNLGLTGTPLPGGVQLAVGGSPAYTVRATAQLYGRPVRRSVAALVRYGRDRTELPVGVVRWYQTAN
jgi:hypothetical protein